MKCSRCEAKAVKGERFCKACRKAVLAEMKEAGYLGPNPRIGGGYRAGDAQENTRETKHGSGHG